jgi:hypothetical protein
MPHPVDPPRDRNVARFIENSPARLILLVIGQWQCRLVRDRQRVTE